MASQCGRTVEKEDPEERLAQLRHWQEFHNSELEILIGADNFGSAGERLFLVAPLQPLCEAEFPFLFPASVRAVKGVFLVFTEYRVPLPFSLFFLPPACGTSFQIGLRCLRLRYIR